MNRKTYLTALMSLSIAGLLGLTAVGGDWISPGDTIFPDDGTNSSQITPQTSSAPDYSNVIGGSTETSNTTGGSTWNSGSTSDGSNSTSGSDDDEDDDEEDDEDDEYEDDEEDEEDGDSDSSDSSDEQGGEENDDSNEDDSDSGDGDDDVEQEGRVRTYALRSPDRVVNNLITYQPSFVDHMVDRFLETWLEAHR
tara:strand:- start:49 stop:633 length:585 start_codon:yes stop_codon:yes gene_type:complete